MNQRSTKARLQSEYKAVTLCARIVFINARLAINICLFIIKIIACDIKRYAVARGFTVPFLPALMYTNSQVRSISNVS